MKKIGFFLLIGILCLDVQLFSHVRQEAEFACVIDRDRLYTAFRDEQVPLEVYETIADGKKEEFSERLFCYFITGDTGSDAAGHLQKKLERKKSPILDEFTSYIDAV